MPDTPQKPRRDEHFVLVVAIDFALNAHIYCGKSRSPRGWPVAMNPAAIDLNLKNRRQQAGKRPIKPIVDGIPTFDEVVNVEKFGTIASSATDGSSNVSVPT